MLIAHGKLSTDVSSSGFSFFSASVSRLCSLLMVSFEEVFQVLSLVFSKCEQFMLLAHCVNFEEVLQVLNLVFFSRFEQFLLMVNFVEVCQVLSLVL